MSKVHAGKTGRKQKGASGSPAIRVIVVLFFILLFAVGASMYMNQNISLQRISSQSEKLTEKQEAAIQANEDAKSIEKKVGSDAYTEEMARNQLGMVKTGETIFDTTGKNS